MYYSFLVFYVDTEGVEGGDMLIQHALQVHCIKIE